MTFNNDNTGDSWNNNFPAFLASSPSKIVTAPAWPVSPVSKSSTSNHKSTRKVRWDKSVKVGHHQHHHLWWWWSSQSGYRPMWWQKDRQVAVGPDWDTQQPGVPHQRHTCSNSCCEPYLQLQLKILLTGRQRPNTAFNNMYCSKVYSQFLKLVKDLGIDQIMYQQQCRPNWKEDNDPSRLMMIDKKPDDCGVMKRWWWIWCDRCWLCDWND